MKKYFAAGIAVFVLVAAGSLGAQEIDLIERANTARWINIDDVPLKWGEEGRELGSVMWVDNKRLEDGKEYARVLYTHPQWKTRGVIIGSYANISIPADGGKIIMAGGFLEGAKDSDGAIFSVLFVRTDVRQRVIPGAPRGLLLCSFQAGYDGRLDRKECDLSRIAGQTGEILLQVSAGINPNSDWAVWTEAKLVFGAAGQTGSKVVQAQPTQPTQAQTPQTAQGQMRMVNALKGHNSRIDFVSVSDNGRYLLTVDSSGESRLWQLPGGRVLNTIRGTGVSSSPTFSPDSRSLSIGRSNGDVEVINASDGRVAHVLRGHSGPVNSAIFSPNGRYVVSAGSDGTARVWDVRSGGEIMSIKHSDRQGIVVRSATFTPDGRFIITVGDDAAARIWEIQIR